MLNMDPNCTVDRGIDVCLMFDWIMDIDCLHVGKASNIRALGQEYILGPSFVWKQSKGEVEEYNMGIGEYNYGAYLKGASPDFIEHERYSPA